MSGDRWSHAWRMRLESELARLPLDEPIVCREIRRTLATDPLAFAMIYLSHHLISEETGGDITFAECHFEWLALAEGWKTQPTEPAADRHAFVAPRGVGKSTWWFLLLPLWAAANKHIRFAAAFADSTSQAETHLSTMKHELDTNALLRADYPDLCHPARRRSGQTVADRAGMLHMRNGFVFAARGIDSALLGLKVGDRRPDLLILDDVEPDEASYSALLAEKRLGTVLDAVFPLNIYAHVVMVGTVTMPGSITHQLVKAANGVEVSDWIGAEGIQAHHHRAILTNDDGTERSIWPDKWSLEYLQSIRHTRSFAKNYDNDPMGREGAYWRKEDFRYGDLEGVTRTALFVDPIVTSQDSRPAKTRSDFTGLAVVSWWPGGERDKPVDALFDHLAGRQREPSAVVVRHAVGVRLTGAPLREQCLALLIQYPEIRRIVVEVNQGGDLWRDVLHDMTVPVQTHTASVSKEVRFAWALEHYQRGRVLHEQRLSAAEEQMVAFPKGSYDDVADAVCAGVVYFLGSNKPLKPGVRSRSYVGGRR